MKIVIGTWGVTNLVQNLIQKITNYIDKLPPEISTKLQNILTTIPINDPADHNVITKDLIDALHEIAGQIEHFTSTQENIPAQQMTKEDEQKIQKDIEKLPQEQQKKQDEQNKKEQKEAPQQASYSNIIDQDNQHKLVKMS